MKVMGNFTQGGEYIHFVFFWQSSLDTQYLKCQNDKFTLSLFKGFRCVFSIKSSVLQQNYCISRINLCGHITSPAGKLGGATDDNDGNKISNEKSKRFNALSNKNSECAAGTLLGILLCLQCTLTSSNLIGIAMQTIVALISKVVKFDFVRNTHTQT